LFPGRMAAPSFAVVARPHWKAELAPLAPAEHAALTVLADLDTFGGTFGGTFGAALDAAFDIDAAFDVASCLARWIALSLLTGIRADQ
jgi:hypothetical protein